MRRIQLSRSGLLVAIVLLVVGSAASFGLGHLLARRTQAAPVAGTQGNEDQRSGPIVSVGGSVGGQPGGQPGGQGNGRTGSNPGSGSGNGNGNGSGKSQPTPQPSHPGGSSGSTGTTSSGSSSQSGSSSSGSTGTSSSGRSSPTSSHGGSTSPSGSTSGKGSGSSGSGVSVTQSGGGQTITVSGDGSSVTITQNGSGTSISVTGPSQGSLGQAGNQGQGWQSQGQQQSWGTHPAPCSASSLGASWPQVARPLAPDQVLIVPDGSAIPVRFRVQGPCAGSASLPARLYLAPMNGGRFIPALSADGTPDGWGTAATSNAFRYDGARGEYRYDLCTEGLAPGAYRLGIDLGNGRLYVVPFALR